MHRFTLTKEPQKIDVPPIKQVSGGGDFSICLSEDGNLYSFGRNINGPLGHGNYKPKTYPEQIVSLKDIDFVECGFSFVYCKSVNNEIYSWGDNDQGQLGIDNRDTKNTPQLIDFEDLPGEVIDIKCGSSHTLVLMSYKTVLVCGSNEHGQLGFWHSRNDPCLNSVWELSEIITISCGTLYSICIDIHHNIYMFGYGQLGLGDLKNKYTPTKHPSLSNIIDVSKGGLHNFVKTSNNEIYAFGYNEYSQLGIKTEDDNQLTPIRVFEDNEDILFSTINKSKAKSARF